jgi:hypothetical protein
MKRVAGQSASRPSLTRTGVPSTQPTENLWRSWTRSGHREASHSRLPTGSSKARSRAISVIFPSPKAMSAVSSRPLAGSMTRPHRAKLAANWFAVDSPVAGDGFEPSPFHPKSSVSAGLAPSVAANLHPYNAQFCTPASTEILQNRARRKWRKCPRMACRTPRGGRLPQIDQCQVDYTPIRVGALGTSRAGHRAGASTGDQSTYHITDGLSGRK